MTHAEFAAWMDGYLVGLGEDRPSSTFLIMEKMSHIQPPAPVSTGVYDTRQYSSPTSVTTTGALSYEQFKSILEGK